MASAPPQPYQDAYGGMTIDQARGQGAGSPRAVPTPGFLDRVQLGYDRAAAGPDYGRNQVQWEDRAQGEIMAALRARGYPVEDYERGMAQLYHGDPAQFDDPRFATSEALDPHSATHAAAGDRAFWRAVDAERRRDPNFMPAYGDVHDLTSLAAHAARQRAAELERIDQAAPQGLGVAGFLGTLAHGAADPLSYIPIGGPLVAGTNSVGRQILSAAVRQGVGNMAITAGEEPFVRQDAARIGQERTAVDFLYEEAAAGTIGAGFGAVHTGAAPAVNALIDAVGPTTLRVARSIAGAEIDPQAHYDMHLAQAFAAAVPPDRMTPDEQAALHVTTRAAEVRRQSPFVPGPAGDDEHAHWLDTALHAITSDRAPPSPAAAASRPIPRSQVAAGTADMSGVRNPAFEQVKARIRQVESGGSDTIRNRMGSSARGRFQFTDGTWLTYYRRRYGQAGSDAQVLARKTDGALQEVLMDDSLMDHQRVLQRLGAPVDAGNLYLLHALGDAGGEAFLRADPNARAIDVYRRIDPRNADAAYRQNPWLHGSVADSINWAHHQMGGGEPVPFTPSPEMAAGDAIPPRGEVAGLEGGADPARATRDALGFDHDPAPMDSRPVLRPDWFASPEEHARAQLRFEAERDARDGFQRVADDGDIPFDPIDHLDRLRAYAATRAPLRPEAVAQALGLTPEEARNVTERLAGQEGSPLLIDKNGVARRRVEPPPAPESLLDFVANRGGIEDVNGDYRAMDAQLWHRGAPFRRRLLRERSADTPRGVAESPQHGEDAMFRAAIDAGYFPEHAGLRGGAGHAADLPDLAQFRDAVDRELRGTPLYTPEDRFGADASAAALGADRDELLQRLEDVGAKHGVELDAATLEDALARHDAGAKADAAVRDAIHAAAFRDAAPAKPEAVAMEEARFADPVGEGAKAQADSLEHDLRMEIASSDGLGTVGREAYARAHGDLWLKPLDQLDHLFEEAKLSEAAQFGRAIELIGFAPSERLSRLLGSEHFNFDRVAALIEKEAAAAGLEIPAAAERIISPKWDDPPLTSLPMSEDIDKLQQAHAAAADNDEHMVASEIGWALRGIDAERIRAVLDGHGDLDAQAAMATVRLGFERLKELGVPSDKVPAAIAAAMERNGVNPATADELTRSILDTLREGGGRKNAPAQRSQAAPQEQLTYRLDEEGGEVDLASVLRELDEEGHSFDEMQACMAPPTAEAAE
jgi:hypothetical protein